MSMKNIKKCIALLLACGMILSLTGCKMVGEAVKDKVGDAISDAVGDLGGDIGQSISDALGGDGSGSISDTINGIIGNAVSDAVGSSVDDAAQNAANEAGHAAAVAIAKQDPSYWCDKFGTNRCPFSIEAAGICFDYHFRDGGDFANWVYTEENTAGWYLYDNHVISSDNTVAINLEGIDSFSSCCTYEAKLYTGEKLDAEAQKSYAEVGVFHVLNSYTPVRTNWGVKLIPNGCGNTFDDLEFKNYDLNCVLDRQEWFDFYIFGIGNPDMNTESVKVWAFEHRDYSSYPEILDAKLVSEGIELAVFAEDSETNSVLARTYIPDKSADGFDDGYVDLVVTYGNSEYVTVGVVTVSVWDEASGGKG